MDDDGALSSDDGGLTADEAFGLLANETRMEVLRLLWAEHDPYAESALTFSELLGGVDYEDAGNFSYHLEKLVGPFVHRTEDGYELREAAHKILRSVQAGTVTESMAVETELERACPNCGSVVSLQYANDRLFVRCSNCESILPHETLPEGTIFVAEVPPAIFDGRSPDEILQAAVTWNAAQYATVTRGVCPECTGRLERSLDVCEDHPAGTGPECSTCGTRLAVWIGHVCENCGYSRHFGLWPYAWQHPEVNAFYLDHGLDVNGLTWTQVGELVRSIEREAVVATDPLRVRHEIRVDDDELAVTFDENLDVVDLDD